MMDKDKQVEKEKFRWKSGAEYADSIGNLLYTRDDIIKAFEEGQKNSK